MSDLNRFAPMLPRVLEEIYQGSAEVFVPTEATLAGYRGYYLNMTRSYGNWLAWPEQPLQELLPTIPLIWLKGEQDGESTIGDTGVGFFPTLFGPRGPTGNSMQDWIDTFDLNVRIGGEYSVAELLSVYPTISTRMIPLFEGVHAQSTIADVKRCMAELLQTLKDEVNGKVWLFCCQESQEPSVGSVDGILKMVESLLPRVAPGTGRRELAFFIGARAYRLLLDGAGWSVLDSASIAGLSRPMPVGVAWVRTGHGPEWNRVDNLGFGISLERREPFHEFLGQFLSHSFTTKKIGDLGSDPYAAMYPLCAGLCGYPKGKKVKALSANVYAELWSIATRMATKGELNFWWLT